MMDLDLLTLHLFSAVKPAGKRMLLEQAGSAAKALDILAQMHHYDAELAVARQLAVGEMRTLDQGQQRAIGIDHEKYPERLAACLDAPLVLFYKGQLDALNRPQALAVIGTRKITSYGKGVGTSIVQGLRDHQSELALVSGLAFGVDVMAHSVSHKMGIPNFAVLAHGLQKVSPRGHTRLAQELVEAGGALISEYPYTCPASKFTFPERNRIVAGLTDATLVVESAEKGGSLITAYQAHSYNREVLAVPGPVHFPMSRGCNNLIKRHVASMVESAEDIFHVMGWQKGKTAQLKLDLSGLIDNDLKMVELLAAEQPLTADQLARQLKIEAPKVQAGLLGLELGGWVRKEGSLGYVLAR